MDRIDRWARSARYCLVRSSVRRTMPWGLLGLTLGGSLVKEWAPLPESYLSNKRNLLNIYFVKMAWAWTLWLLLPFIGITNYYATRNTLGVMRRLTALLVGTVVWYTCTRAFLHIEDLTGNCYKSPALEVLHQQHPSKLQCQQAGGFWHGFDISGHSFLLSYCALMIVEEMAVMHNLKISRNPRMHMAVNCLFLALSCLTVIWLFMFLTTAVYFHDFSQKLFGTLVGLLGWYGTYRVWYLMPFSPGLPPQSASLSSQKPKRSL